jgi:hypothetical protein
MLLQAAVQTHSAGQGERSHEHLLNQLQTEDGGISLINRPESTDAPQIVQPEMAPAPQASVKSLTPFQPGSAPSPAPSHRPKRPNRRRLLGQRDWKIRGLAAAIAVLAISLAWIIFGPKAALPVVLTSPATNPTPGISVTPVILETGFARLALDGNVQALIQGPAEYAILSGSRIRLNVGKLTAIVPHSVVGFKVLTREAEITDLGTEFAVEAGEQYTRTDVFDGRVSVEPRYGTSEVKQILSAEQANRVLPNGRMIPEEPYPRLFVRVGDYDVRHAAETRQAAAFERWSAYSHKLRRDPSLLAYYTFDNESESPWKLLNRATATAGKYDGDIFDATWDQGHLPGRHGVRFNGKNSCVTINIPDKSDQMTLAAWVRVDSWAHEYNGLLMSNDFNRDGEIHWQFRPRNRITVAAPGGVGVVDGLKVPCFTATSPTPENALGQWVFRAVTLDAKASTITHYRNGVLLIVAKSQAPSSLSIGPAQIGRWDYATYLDRDTNRTLDGSIDELAIFKRVLSTAEIKAIYDAEKPD